MFSVVQMPWGATIDGVLLQDLPLNVIASGNSNAVDGVMMGTNHDEGTIFVARLAKVVPGVHTSDCLPWVSPARRNTSRSRSC